MLKIGKGYLFDLVFGNAILHLFWIRLIIKFIIKSLSDGLLCATNRANATNPNSLIFTFAVSTEIRVGTQFCYLWSMIGLLVPKAIIEKSMGQPANWHCTFVHQTSTTPYVGTTTCRTPHWSYIWNICKGIFASHASGCFDRSHRRMACSHKVDHRTFQTSARPFAGARGL